ncbi:LarC family nickel insertion protein [Lichenicoccus sp.]|uniref:LarC family nickel insertion protein n=1 Tax=Lichenicoccus sp. TaxID=2781899 RepID=UPI003D135919
MMHVHLDAIGGVAGDMFAAAMLDAFPQHAGAVIACVQRSAPVSCTLVRHDDGILAGARFAVADTTAAPDDPVHEHHHEHGHHEHQHGHGHVQWRRIRDDLLACGLPPDLARHAVGIFGALAEAEGRVHGVAPDAVAFHEVGAADSIADIVAAASLVAALGDATSWSVSALPLGSGRVRTAHGIMPVPAPATTLLLDGFAVIDDGVAGERITPTGAAILAWLRTTGRLQPRPPGRLGATGIGFGTRRLPGISNCLRALVLHTDGSAEPVTQAAHRLLGVVAFEVDDQSGEDLAAGLDRLRDMPEVHDVVQWATIGKKGRLAVHVQVLAAPDRLDRVVEACFAETTTIGLRTHLVEGRALHRRMRQVRVDGHPVQVKLVDRPGGRTGKAEADHLGAAPGHAGRQELRRRAEQAAEGDVDGGRADGSREDER